MESCLRVNIMLAVVHPDMPVALCGETGIRSPLITYDETVTLHMLFDDRNKGLLISSLPEAKNRTPVRPFDLEHSKDPCPFSPPAVPEAPSSVLPKHNINVIK